MAESPKKPTLTSTLHHVQNAQQNVDADVSWSNLHVKMQKWVEDALRRENLPPDRSLEDLTQDVVFQVWKDIAEFQVEPEASFSGWVKTIAQRKLHDVWRRTRAKKRGGGRQKHLGDFDETGGREHFADDREPRPSMLVRLQELSSAMQHALEQLSDKHRRVIELRLFEGKAYADMLQELGYTKEVTVRSLYMRAIERLQDLVREFDD